MHDTHRQFGKVQIGCFMNDTDIHLSDDEVQQLVTEVLCTLEYSFLEY